MGSDYNWVTVDDTLDELGHSAKPQYLNSCFRGNDQIYQLHEINYAR